MPNRAYRKDTTPIIIGKAIFATKYLGALIVLICILCAQSLMAADEAIPEPHSSPAQQEKISLPQEELPVEPPSPDAAPNRTDQGQSLPDPAGKRPIEPSPIEASPPTETQRQLSATDCVKCHHGIINAIKENGKAHRDKLTCQQCHIGHPPRDSDVIPSCNRCHKGIAHFGLNNCLECHTNPHTPLEITLSRTITAQCTTCHNGQLEQLQENRSVHSTLDCTACHTRHGYRPPCFNCHAAHLDGMANETCQHCHKPHMPLEVSFPPDTPSEYCGPCHPDVFAQLAASRAKHRNVLCAQCHATKHKTIPACRKCHPSPHSESMLSQSDNCGKCHGIAHNLKLNRIDIRLENRPH